MNLAQLKPSCMMPAEHEVTISKIWAYLPEVSLAPLHSKLENRFVQVCQLYFQQAGLINRLKSGKGQPAALAADDFRRKSGIQCWIQEDVVMVVLHGLK